MTDKKLLSVINIALKRHENKLLDNLGLPFEEILCPFCESVDYAEDDRSLPRCPRCMVMNACRKYLIMCKSHCIASLADSSRKIEAELAILTWLWEWKRQLEGK